MASDTCTALPLSVSAQRDAAPTFGLQAPATSCPGADPGYTCNYTYLMEFDWAIRADSSIVAVVTPAGTHTQKQFGCVILNFFLESGTTTPFGSFWATVTDTDTNVPMGFSEGAGPNGCTYEPTSNNGVVIVRSLTNSSSSIQTYSLVNTGLIP